MRDKNTKKERTTTNLANKWRSSFISRGNDSAQSLNYYKNCGQIEPNNISLILLKSMYGKKMYAQSLWNITFIWLFMQSATLDADFLFSLSLFLYYLMELLSWSIFRVVLLRGFIFWHFLQCFLVLLGGFNIFFQHLSLLFFSSLQSSRKEQ